jgi:serine/threonine protein kinase
VTAPQLGPGGVVAGKYSIRALLGNGGAVITYHAVSTQGQDVALKIYDPAVGQHANIMQAMEQAYAGVNALPANSTAPILDAGYDQATGAPFSVVELLRMPSIAQQNRRFSSDEVVQLLQGMSRSLDLIHLKKVVHGALKPTNVFVGPGFNPVLVVDFAANLAKGVAPTQEGYALMAPWIAPEQIQGGAIGPPADVFSAGLVAFYAMTGRSYWRSCQGQTPDLTAWQQEIAGTRVPASARAAELGVPLSPTVDMALWKALALDANERYRSVSEFASTMEDALKKDNAGNAATMALPAYESGPPGPAEGPPSSPPTMALPSPVNIPGAPPVPGGYGVPNSPATMALPQSAFEPPPGMGGPGMGGPMSPGGMGLGGTMMMSGPPQGPNYAQMSSGPGGFPAAQMSSGPGGFPAAQMSSGPGGMPMAQMSNGQMGPNGYDPAAQAYQHQGQRGPNDQYSPPPAVIGAGVPPQQGGNKNKIIAIVGAVIGVALIATAVTVFLLQDGTPEEKGPLAVGSGAPTASSSAGTTAPEPTPPAAPTPAETGAPEPPASASAAPEEPKTATVTVTCTPQCDIVKVDGKLVDFSKPFELKPGIHKFEAVKSGHLPRVENVEVKAGEPLDKSYELTPLPTQPKGQGTKPGCTPGQFIKKCK